MSRPKKKGKITMGGNLPRPGQTSPPTIILTQPKRFGIDIADYMQAIRSAENVDYSRRSKLYDLYSDILMDTHLSSVIEKRKLAVLSSKIEFQRGGKPDEAIGEQIRSPWFRRLIGDILDAKFYGFTLCQFYKGDDGWITYNLLPRKNVDPVRRLILRNQADITGTSWDEYADLLFVGNKDDLGLLAKAAPWVIYKRGTVADWAQFSEIFGMPLREYIYETDDDKARERVIEDAENTGSLVVFIHGKETTMNLLESQGKSASSDLYDTFTERCNNELSKLFLGNTLTTESGKNGTQALGTVHGKVEERVARADRLDVLDTLNYDMTDIFLAFGIDTKGGEFVYPEPKDVDLTSKASILTQLSTTFNLPIGDDTLYETFGIEKPKNYDELKKLHLAATEPKQEPTPSKEDLQDEPKQEPTPPEPTKKEKRAVTNWLKRFFGVAPRDGAALDW
jgi:phage gp29-like protein